MGVLAQDQYLSENQVVNSRKSSIVDMGKMEVLNNPAYTEDKIEYQKVVITLTVDVDGLLLEPDEDYTYKYCTLSDNNNGIPKSNSQEFLSDVYGGRRVRWKASSENESSIKIVYITIYPGDSILFRKGRILERKFWHIGGGVKNDLKLNKKESHYNIYFIVKKEGRKYGPYRLDPKLRANTRRSHFSGHL
jgi:hypothetical protein